MRVCGGRYCSALNCSNNAKSRPDLSFFSFPKQEERCKKWVINTRRDDLHTRSSSYLNRNCTICTEHFERSQFMNDKRCSLVWNAVPTLFDVLKKPKHITIQQKEPKTRCFPTSPRVQKSVLEPDTLIGATTSSISRPNTTLHGSGASMPPRKSRVNGKKRAALLKERDRLRKRAVRLKWLQEEEEYQQRQRVEDNSNQSHDQHTAGLAAKSLHMKSRRETALAAQREYTRQRRAAETPEQRRARLARDRQRMRRVRAKQAAEKNMLISSNLQLDTRADHPSGTEGYIVWKGVPTSSWIHKPTHHHPRLAAILPGTESTSPLEGVEEVNIKPEPQKYSESCEVYVETDIKMEPLDSEDPDEEGGHSDPIEMSHYLAVSLEEGHSHTQPQDTQPKDTQHGDIQHKNNQPVDDLSQDTQPQDSQPCKEKSLNLLKGGEEIYMKPEPREHSELCEVHVETDIKKEPLYSEDPGEQDRHSDSLEISQYLAVSLEEGHSHSLHTQPQDSQHCKES